MRLDLRVVEAVLLGVDDLHRRIVGGVTAYPTSAGHGRSARAAHPEASLAPLPARPPSSASSIGRCRHPAPYSEALREVAIVIEDEPTPSSWRRTASARGDSMYGLYEGVPRTEYAADWAASPNRITLFRVPLEEDFPTGADLEAEVRMTVLHELAHHLGIDDDRLDELGAG